jgi:nucleotide-binding universal stress UspA family protein
MSQLTGGAPFVGSVFHASDFSAEAESAFPHALAIALVRRATLTILHAGDVVEEDWARFPAVRATLERWGLLEPGSERRDVFEKLSVSVTKIVAEGNPVAVASRYIENHEPDLVVLGTEGRDGVARWLRPSVAQRVARRTRSMTLFVPKRGRGIVSVADGNLSLRRMLVPVDREPDAGRALLLATQAAQALGDPPVEITLLHVGEGGMPELARPEGEDGFRYRERLLDEGDVVETILGAAAQSDLVVMATDGRDGPLDVFRGSHTERVVRAVDCPILAVPAYGGG